MALREYNENNKDEEQEETEINHLQKPVSRWEANVRIRRDEWDHQFPNTNCCCQNSHLIAQENNCATNYPSTVGQLVKAICLWDFTDLKIISWLLGYNLIYDSN